MIKLTEYELARNSLIPQAEVYADRIAGLAPKSEKAYSDWVILWNKTYHARMDSLWKDIKEVKK